jgi:ABC-type transport system involved in cytochrome c biogenesis permease subunit
LKITRLPARPRASPGVEEDSMKTGILALAALSALGWAGPARGELADALRGVAVQDGGRVKPLDTFAREAARRISGARPFTGGESVQGLDAVEWTIAALADSQAWKAKPIVRVVHAELRGRLGLAAERDRYSFDELVGNRAFMDAAERLLGRLREDPEARLQPLESEILSLYETLSMIAGIASGEAIRISEQGADETGAWLPISGLDRLGTPEGRQAREALGGLVAAYAGGDRLASLSSAREFAKAAARLSPAADREALAREVSYNGLKPFRWAWVLLLLGSLLLLSSLVAAPRVLGASGFALVIAGFLLNGYGMLLRTLISGRAPVTNMYESVVFVAWGAVAVALVFEAFSRVRWVAACAALLGSVCLVLADNLPILDGSIEPLVPVLRDNMWLTLHVLTIMLGYAAYLLAAGLAHLSLGLFAFAPGRAGLIRTLSSFLYRSLQVGTLFLAIGTLLGGVWASYSWGRFWGWDPKETWALIALLGYLAILHGRFAGWFKDFGMAVGSIGGFLLVMMAWYGVNYVLGTGLHSYGFGAGGGGYAALFVLVEAALVGFATLRYRGRAPADLAVAARLRTAQ